MIVTFRTTPTGVGTLDTGYVNFLRCVTAILTANAGTTSLTVNPYTANNTINTGSNCIVSIDSNLEGGGWLTSSVHHVPSSANNVAASIQSIVTVAALTYKADFYKASGKASQPYYKLCFHSYNDYSTSADWGFTEGVATTLRQTRSLMNVNQGANMLITYGSSTTTDWSGGTFAPAAGAISTKWNGASQTTSYTMNGDMFSAAQNNGPGLVYTDTSVQYTMAVGADYCLIWESKVGDTYAGSYFGTTTIGNGTTYWNNARYGSMYYMGTRETQPWEDTRIDNPPWVAWNITTNNFGQGAINNPWAPDGVCAYMATLNSAGTVAAPLRRYTQNARLTPFFNGSNHSLTSTTSTGAGNVDNATRNGIDCPIFTLRNWGSLTSAQALTYGWNTNTDNFTYLPQVDPTSGTLIPGAYPIDIKSSNSSQWNAGGKCRSIYKSLGMPFATMKSYWQATNQKFKIDGVDYLPIVIYEDMWLIRVV